VVLLKKNVIGCPVFPRMLLSSSTEESRSSLDEAVEEAGYKRGVDVIATVSNR